MVPGILKLLNAQIIKLDRLNGSDALAEDMVYALIATLQRYAGSSEYADLMRELLILHDELLLCRPRMPHLILDCLSMFLET